eukprot:m.90269 g.90269  ORF g.90269 m.90269 type:complete len:619 (+) comp12913_c3_seq6:295-2151(+)
MSKASKHSHDRPTKWCGTCGRFEATDDFGHATLRVLSDTERQQKDRSHPATVQAHQPIVPSLEVMSERPLIPTLQDQALRSITVCSRLNEVIRSYQIDVATVLQSAEYTQQAQALMRFVPKVPHPESVVESEYSDFISVAPELEYMLDISISVLSRALHSVRSAVTSSQSQTKAANSRAERLEQTMFEQQQQYEERIRVLEHQLHIERAKDDGQLYLWPSFTNDLQLHGQLKQLQSAYGQLHDAHEATLAQVDALNSECQSLRHALALSAQQALETQLANARTTGASGVGLVTRSVKPPPPPLTTTQSQVQIQREQSQHKQRTGTPEHSLAPLDDLQVQRTSQPPRQEEVEGEVDGRRPTGSPMDGRVSPLGLSISQMSVPPSRNQVSTPAAATVATRTETAPAFKQMAKSATERLQQIPDLKLASFFAMYVVHCRHEAAREEAEDVFRLSVGRQEKVKRFLLKWHNKRINAWRERFVQLTTIQDQLSRYATPQATSPLTTRGSTSGLPTSQRKRRSMITFKQLTSKPWTMESAQSSSTKDSAAGIVTPRALALQAARAHRGEVAGSSPQQTATGKAGNTAAVITAEVVASANVLTSPTARATSPTKTQAPIQLPQLN